MRILVAGELNVDLILQNYTTFPVLGREILVEDMSLTLGSASAICASGLAKLADDVSFIGKVGLDAWGDLCVNSLASAGVDCSFIRRDGTVKTGITVSITSSNDRALVTYLGGSIADLRAGDIREEHLEGFNHLHVSSFFLQRALRPELKSLFARAKKHGLSTSLDPGFDPEERWQKDLIDTLSQVDVFLPNEVELEAISGKQNPSHGMQAIDNGSTLTVAKLGKQGCMAIQKGKIVSVPAFRVHPVDTTGAGDTFNAGFLHSWLNGAELRDALLFGAACGALSTLSPGGIASQPNAAQAREFIASNSDPKVENRTGAAL